MNYTLRYRVFFSFPTMTVNDALAAFEMAETYALAALDGLNMRNLLGLLT